MKTCKCAETTITYPRTKKRPKGGSRVIGCFPGHDCVYVSKRNALIPQAEEYADKAVGAKSPRWTAVFSAKMDRLAAAL